MQFNKRNPERVHQTDRRASNLLEFAGTLLQLFLAAAKLSESASTLSTASQLSACIGDR